MELGRYGCPFIHFGGLRRQDHTSMNVSILNNRHARQKWDEKKAFDQVKEKKKFKWDEFQTQAQQM